MKIIRIVFLRAARYRLDAEAATTHHPTGLDAGPAGTTCGGCTWARPDGGGLRCALLAPDEGDGPVVEAGWVGCVHHQRILDCDACGACCREAFDSVPVSAGDDAIRRHTDLFQRHADGWCDIARVPSPTGCGTWCAALYGDGSAGRPFRCRAYADRPSACSELEIGSDGCLFARRRVGLTADPRPE